MGGSTSRSTSCVLDSLVVNPPMEAASRRERRRAERQERKEHKDREKQQQKRTTILRNSLLSLIGFILLAGGTYWGYGKWASGSPAEFAASMGNRHIRQFEIGLTRYNSDPPTSGPQLTAPIPGPCIVGRISYCFSLRVHLDAAAERVFPAGSR